jgi:hypothetical protein
MRLILTLLAVLVTLSFQAQTNKSTDVEISGLPVSMKQGETLKFELIAKKDIKAEVAIFMDTYLAYQANAEIKSGILTYEFDTTDWKKGKYYVLVKNETIHYQLDFVLE